MPRRDVRSLLPVLASGFLRLALPGVGRTWRLRVLGGEHLDRLVATGEPALLCFWHDGLPALSYIVYRLRRRGLPMTLLVSRSRDGEILARLGKGWGFDVVRGSSSRGGREAILSLYHRLKREASSPVAVPDGPRGPRRRFKAGALLLAQASGIPILPLAAAAGRAWTLRSWDRMEIPKPFTRVTVAVGAPQRVPRRLAGDAREAERQRLERLLLELGERARADVG